ncbi:MAG: hypothetical protein JSS49_02690 [Planctomycetes bacterium]|nr:hypothetical protein [Planctomycetota bacterium]
MNGVWQLARQALVTDSRRAGSHAVRFGLMAVLYIAVAAAHFHQTRTASGLTLFHAQLLITAFYLTINAIFGFSQAITEEKEDGTLGLLRLADISPLSILLGKTSGRLIDAGLLVGIQIPFTIVAMTLGGVSWSQIVAAYWTLAIYLWLLATLGIAASVTFSTGSAAARGATILVALYVLPPYLAMTSSLRSPALISLYQRISLPMRLTAVTESSFNESPWCPAMAFGTLGGFVCLCWSWWVFDRRTLTADASGHAGWRWESRVQSRRAWSCPIVWREFQFLTGGRRWLVIRTLGYVLLLVSMVFIQDSIGHVFAWAALISGLFAAIDGTWSASRLFRDEVREQTWSSLLQTPHSVARLAFDKATGWLLGMLPSVVMPYLYIVMTIAVHENTRFDMAIELLIGSLTVGVANFAYLHLLVLMSLYHGWKATPLTLTIYFALAWVYVFSVFTSRMNLTTRCAFFLFTALVLAAVMMVLQLLIIRRLTKLGETA